jgi:hypothetical protein
MWQGNVVQSLQTTVARSKRLDTIDGSLLAARAADIDDLNNVTEFFLTF